MIRYKCSKCGTILESPSSMAGHEEKCPECGVTIAVPQATLAPVQVDGEEHAPKNRTSSGVQAAPSLPSPASRFRRPTLAQLLVRVPLTGLAIVVLAYVFIAVRPRAGEGFVGGFLNGCLNGCVLTGIFFVPLVVAFGMVLGIIGLLRQSIRTRALISFLTSSIVLVGSLNLGLGFFGGSGIGAGVRVRSEAVAKQDEKFLLDYINESLSAQYNKVEAFRSLSRRGDVYTLEADVLSLDGQVVGAVGGTVYLTYKDGHRAVRFNLHYEYGN